MTAEEKRWVVASQSVGNDCQLGRKGREAGVLYASQ